MAASLTHLGLVPVESMLRHGFIVAYQRPLVTSSSIVLQAHARRVRTLDRVDGLVETLKILL